MKTRPRGWAFWAVQVPGWALLVYLVYAQGISAFGYELGVAMGTQEPAEAIPTVLHPDVTFRGSLGQGRRGQAGFAAYVEPVHGALGDCRRAVEELTGRPPGESP